MEQKKMIGKYAVIGLAGAGSFGKVHKVVKEDEGKVYAIKEVTKNNMSEGVFNNLLREVQISKQLDHPNLSHCILTMESKNSFYMVFDFCHGGDLEKYLKSKKRVELSKAMDIARQLRDGYQYLFQNNIMHRDLKLENILFVDKEQTQIKISDFGSSKVSLLGSTVIGTPKYMALEVLNENEKYNCKADLWSLALCFWELLYGLHHFPFSLASKKDLINDIKLYSGQNLRFPAEPKFPPEVKDFFVRCLQVSPESRIEAKEFFSHPFFDLDLSKYDAGARKLEESPAKPMDKSDSSVISGDEKAASRFPKIHKFLKGKIVESRTCYQAAQELYKSWPKIKDKKLGACVLGISLMLLERAKKRCENLILSIEKGDNYYELEMFKDFLAEGQEAEPYLTQAGDLLATVKALDSEVYGNLTDNCPPCDAKEEINDALYRKPTKDGKVHLLKSLVENINQNIGKNIDQGQITDFLAAYKKALMLMGGKGH